MASNKEYAVNWKNHMSHMKEAFESLFANNEFVDVTLYCEGHKIGAHKMVLSACSPYFRNIFKDVPCQHHVIVLNNVEFAIMQNLIHFIYHGEVSVHTSKLNVFLRTAQALKISGLMDAKCLKEPPEATAAVEPSAETSTKRKRDSNSHTEVKVLRSPQSDATAVQPEAPEELGLMDVNVKCEPNELVDIFEPIEDPLQQDSTSHDYLQETQDMTEEEELKWRFVGPPARKSEGSGSEMKRKRCEVCRDSCKRDRKTKYSCKVCSRPLCLEHVCPICDVCFELGSN